MISERESSSFISSFKEVFQNEVLFDPSKIKDESGSFSIKHPVLYDITTEIFFVL